MSRLDALAKLCAAEARSRAGTQEIMRQWLEASILGFNAFARGGIRGLWEAICFVPRRLMLSYCVPVVANHFAYVPYHGARALHDLMMQFMPVAMELELPLMKKNPGFSEEYGLWLNYQEGGLYGVLERLSVAQDQVWDRVVLEVGAARAQKFQRGVVVVLEGMRGFFGIHT